MFNARIAGHVFAVDNKYDYIKEYYKDYITDEAPEFVISATNEEIASENHDGGNWAECYLETLAVYRKICEKLIYDNIVLFHSSALAIHGKAVLFTAPSGTGKSTHAMLWRKHFGSEVQTINDDKPLIKLDEKIVVYGTPYGGKDDLQNNICAEVAAIVVLHQAKENTIKKLAPNDAFPLLLNQTYRCSSIEAMTLTMPLVSRLSHLPVRSVEVHLHAARANCS